MIQKKSWSPMSVKLHSHFFLQSDDDCAPGCVEKTKTTTCPPGLFMIDHKRCVSVADCNCRLNNQQAIPVCLVMCVKNRL